MRIARNTIRSRDRPLGCTTLVLETHSLSWLSAPSPIVPHDEQKAASNWSRGSGLLSGRGDCRGVPCPFRQLNHAVGAYRTPPPCRARVAHGARVAVLLMPIFYRAPTSKSRKNRLS